jgi:hypothetical protein
MCITLYPMGMANISKILMYIELGLSSFQCKGIDEHEVLNSF